MRINKFVALATGMSRRAADKMVQEGKVTLNGHTATAGDTATETDTVLLGNRPITPPVNTTTIMLNKPVGYVVSREGQGSKTVYSLLPPQYRQLKPIGRLDKDSSGLLLLTNDGRLAHELTHPSQQKTKTYEIELGTPLQPLHRQMISDYGIQLEDGPSRLALERVHEGNDKAWRVTMHEGRNRQIRRTFASLGYTVTKLHRTHFGSFSLGQLPPGSLREV